MPAVDEGVARLPTKGDTGELLGDLGSANGGLGEDGDGPWEPKKEEIIWMKTLEITRIKVG